MAAPMQAFDTATWHGHPAHPEREEHILGPNPYPRHTEITLEASPIASSGALPPSGPTVGQGTLETVPSACL